jgi:hypothetical protein
MKTIRILLVCVFSAFVVGCEEEPEIFSYQITYSEIYQINSNGTGLLQLTSGRDFIHYADYIPQSTKIFFVRSPRTFNGISLSGGPQIINTLDLNNGVIDTLVYAEIFASSRGINEELVDTWRKMTVTANGAKILFVGYLSSQTSDRRDIFSVDIQSKQVTNLTNTIDGRYVGQFHLSFDETKIVYTELQSDKNNSYLYIMNADMSDKVLLDQNQNEFEYYYPQLLNGNNEIVYIEKKYSASPGIGRLKIFNIENRTSRYVKDIDVGTFFFYEITKDNNIVGIFGGLNPSFRIMNLITLADTILDIPLLTKQLTFDREGDYLYSFDESWYLYKRSVDGLQKSQVFGLTNRSGTTHLPRLSYTGDKILFIGKDDFSIKQGEKK